MIRIVLADDQHLVRAGFRSILEVEAGLSIVGEAATGAEAVEVVRAERPDVVLMDIQMPGMDGLEATETIGETGDGTTRIIILTTFDADEYVYRALAAGASGFLLKDTEPEDLIRAIHVAVGGEALLAPSVTKRLIAEIANKKRRAPLPPRLRELTDREREVLILVAEGLSNTEIAERLVLSPATAKTHVSRVMTKLGSRDRAQLVVLAYESGLVEPGWRT
ncbi:response regulator transcription factor [Saxibacter everestensis]|uniref:Response regulator transcription factor n=1 Tax=Saxibacter everestensis TaxID=2909229 RepID=A0ABY8QZA1_9MICO|nr:response regulator transcription factor [Brevibacteriaceae bacterium ZFBP1038]